MTPAAILINSSRSINVSPVLNTVGKLSALTNVIVPRTPETV